MLLMFEADECIEADVDIDHLSYIMQKKVLLMKLGGNLIKGKSEIDINLEIEIDSTLKLHLMQIDLNIDIEIPLDIIQYIIS